MDQLRFDNQLLKRRRRNRPREWKVVGVGECPPPEEMSLVNTPEQAVTYWRNHIATMAHYNPDCECLAVLILNTKYRVRGHHLVSIGSLNETAAHPREIFRVAVAAAGYCIVLMHNHPSGEPEPSDMDKRLTRRVKEAGELLQIEVRDHVIVGHQRFFSFRQAGMM